MLTEAFDLFRSLHDHVGDTGNFQKRTKDQTAYPSPNNDDTGLAVVQGNVVLEPLFTTDRYKLLFSCSNNFFRVVDGGRGEYREVWGKGKICEGRKSITRRYEKVKKGKDEGEKIEIKRGVERGIERWRETERVMVRTEVGT